METNQTESTESTGATTEKPARKRKAAAKKAEGKSKTALARSIFKAGSRGKNGPNRAKIIERFISEAKLTKAGASTYYQKFKKEFEAGSKGSKAAS